MCGSFPQMVLQFKDWQMRRLRIRWLWWQPEQFRNQRSMRRVLHQRNEEKLINKNVNDSEEVIKVIWNEHCITYRLPIIITSFYSKMIQTFVRCKTYLRIIIFQCSSSSNEIVYEFLSYVNWWKLALSASKVNKPSDKMIGEFIWIVHLYTQEEKYWNFYSSIIWNR